MPLKRNETKRAPVPREEPALPAITNGDDGFGEMSAASYEMPRMKMLQAVSPEVQQRVHPDAKAGVFWHAALNESLGESVKVVVVRQTPYWGLLEPGQGKLLARADLRGNWLDGADNQTFRVEIGRKPVDWHTRSNLNESGLGVLGTSGGYWAAATPSFDVVLWLEGEDYNMPVMMTFKKTSARPLRELFTILDMRKNSGVPRHAQSFNMKSRLIQGKEAAYYVPTFENAGIIRDEKHVKDLQALARQLAGAQIRVVGDEAEGGEGSAGPRGPQNYADDTRSY